MQNLIVQTRILFNPYSNNTCNVLHAIGQAYVQAKTVVMLPGLHIASFYYRCKKHIFHVK